MGMVPGEGGETHCYISISVTAGFSNPTKSHYEAVVVRRLGLTNQSFPPQQLTNTSPPTTSQGQIYGLCLFLFPLAWAC
jgi:hypothetical protein